MCGIAGFIGFEDNIKLAEKANIIQSHRGPDNQSVWADDYIAMAHQRLSIIDLSDAANQPFHKHNLVLIFNGEIYNYKELQKQLKEEKGVEFKTSSDTEVILEMYRNYGVESLNKLIGMFVFVIYNKDTEELLIARDHFGIKPLFYTQINGTFAFSSELKTLVAVPGFTKEINHKALVSSLTYLWVSGNESIFNNCYKLPPAHYLKYDKNTGIELVKFWELDDKALPGPSNEGEFAESVGAVMRHSIERHMVADVPVSSFLSGGLDSSFISVLAKEINTNLSTYTIGTSKKDKKGESMPDDEKFANELAEKFGFDHNIIRINPDIIKDLPKMVRMLDEPIGDPAALNTFLICKAAREKGVKVLLSGMGADEIFFGYRRHKATILAVKFKKIPSFLRKIITKGVAILPVRFLGRGFKLGRWAKRFIGFSSLPLEESYMRSYSYYDKEQLKELLNEKYWPAIELVRDEHKQIFNSKYKDDIVNKICYTDISMFMLGLNLTYTDRASMGASVEVRVPFIDKVVITNAMQIPGRYKIKEGKSKYILKKAAEKILPFNIIYRPKASFGAPIRSWISNDLKEMVDELLSEKAIQKRGILNFSYVKQLIDNDRKGVTDNAYQIYQLLTLELWFREYLDV